MPNYPDMIRFRGYGVIAEKPRIGKLGQIFPYTLYEKLCVGSKKWIPHFMMGTTSSITMQSLGKIAQCAPAVGAKMWCLFVCPAPSPEHRAFEGCIVRTSIALRFIVQFRRGLQRFFRMDCSFRRTTWFSFSSLGGATIIAKLRSKIAKI